MVSFGEGSSKEIKILEHNTGLYVLLINTGLKIAYITFQVLKESFKIYCAINDGIINLVDKVR